ncbi:hypothetical protein [Rothia sp. L_38]|uniref:hypothetical protein n=1 Tax=Rothia sp. L_38 TaxID=3422315 RepID=UPI003D6A4F5F
MAELLSTVIISIFVLLVIYYAGMVFLLAPQYLTINCVKDSVDKIIFDRFNQRYRNEEKDLNIPAGSFCKLVELSSGVPEGYLSHKRVICSCRKGAIEEGLQNNKLQIKAKEVCEATLGEKSLFKGDFLDRDLKYVRRVVLLLRFKLLFWGISFFIKDVFLRVLDVWGRYVTLAAVISVVASFFQWVSSGTGGKSIDQLVGGTIENLSVGALVSLMVATVLETLKIIASFEQHKWLIGFSFLIIVIILSIAVDNDLFGYVYNFLTTSLEGLGILKGSLIFIIIFIEIVLICSIFRMRLFKLYSVGRFYELICLAVLVVLSPVWVEPFFAEFDMQEGCLGVLAVFSIAESLNRFLCYLENIKFINHYKSSEINGGQPIPGRLESFIIFILSLVNMLILLVLVGVVYLGREISSWLFIVPILLSCGVWLYVKLMSKTTVMDSVKNIGIPVEEQSLKNYENFRTILVEKYFQSSLRGGVVSW